MTILEQKYSKLIEEIGYPCLLNLPVYLKEFLKKKSSSLQDKVEALEVIRDGLRGERR